MNRPVLIILALSVTVLVLDTGCQRRLFNLDSSTGTDATGTDSGGGTDAMPGTDATPGTDSTPGTDANMGCAPMTFMFNDPTCGTCAEAACCPQIQACDGSPDCANYFACIGACTDMTCISNCNAANPNGMALVAAVDSCANANCPACVPMGLCGTTLTTNDTACDACLDTFCCPGLIACAGDTACFDCITGIPAMCAASVNDETVRTCWDNSCQTQCGGPAPF